MITEDQKLCRDPCEPAPAPAAEPAGRKRPTRTRRLLGAALLALVAAAGAVLLPPLLKKSRARPASPVPAMVAPKPADPEPLPTVQAAWDRLDLAAMPAEVTQDLASGRYYYDKRFPGNFGLAIGYWQQALARPGAVDRDGIKLLVASAQSELARQFTADSGDAVVLLKQGRKDRAVLLLGKMRADFAVTAPQYVWASRMLSRHRR